MDRPAFFEQTNVVSWFILAYLYSNPDAKDTVDGVERWWLKGIEASTDSNTVQGSLDHLVKLGWLVSNNRRGTGTVYGLRRLQPARTLGGAGKSLPSLPEVLGRSLIILRVQLYGLFKAHSSHFWIAHRKQGYSKIIVRTGLIHRFLKRFQRIDIPLPMNIGDTEIVVQLICGGVIFLVCVVLLVHE